MKEVATKVLQIKIFNDAAKAYIQMFGGALPLGIGYPELTTSLLLKAVADKQPMAENIPKTALS